MSPPNKIHNDLHEFNQIIIRHAKKDEIRANNRKSQSIEMDLSMAEMIKVVEIHIRIVPENMFHIFKKHVKLSR